METRKTVVVYDSFYAAIQHLSNDAAKLALFKGMMEYGLYGTEPEFETSELKLAWTFYKPNMDANMKRYQRAVENGKKGGQAKAANNPSKSVPIEPTSSSYEKVKPEYKGVKEEVKETRKSNRDYINETLKEITG